jgi:acyl carrier protein phosphodiesterase
LIQLEEGGPDAGSTSAIDSTTSRQPNLPISRTTSETAPTLIYRILSDGQWLSPRDIHDALYEQGWKTKSKTPMNVVRNTLADMADRQGRLQKRKENDGTVRFALVPENDDTPNLI